MEVRVLSPKVRERRPSRRAAPEPSTSIEAVLRAGIGRFGRCALRCARAMAVSRPIAVRVFLEVFSGSERFSAKMKQSGYWVLPWDITKGDSYDLRGPAHRSLLRGWILSRAIIAMHVSTPCGTWSTARSVRPGPRPLRSDLHPLGLPGLTEGEQERIRIGSSLMQLSASLLQVCAFMQVPCTLENPSHSRLWIAPPIKLLLHRQRIASVVSDFGAWGTRWQKRTNILGFHIDLSSMSVTCSNACGRCDFTSKPHVRLVGKTSTSKFRTRTPTSWPWRGHWCLIGESCFRGSINCQCYQVCKKRLRHAITTLEILRYIGVELRYLVRLPRSWPSSAA